MRLNVTQNAEEKMSKNNDRRKKHIKGGLILKEDMSLALGRGLGKTVTIPLQPCLNHVNPCSQIWKHPFCSLKTGSIHRKTLCTIHRGDFQTLFIGFLVPLLQVLWGIFVLCYPPTYHSHSDACQARGGHKKILALPSFSHFWSLIKMHSINYNI